MFTSELAFRNDHCIAVRMLLAICLMNTLNFIFMPTVSSNVRFTSCCLACGLQLWYTLDCMQPHMKKKSDRFNLGDRDGHSTCSPLPLRLG
jgi:hypothetical protein